MILNIRNVVTLSKTQYFEISIAIKKKEKTDLSCKRTIGYLDKDSIEIYIFQKYNHFAASGAELKLKFLYLNERTLTKLFNGDTIYLFFLNVSFLRCTTIQLKREIRFRDRIILLSEFAAQKLCIFLAYISRQELELDPCEKKSFTAE